MLFVFRKCTTDWQEPVVKPIFLSSFAIWMVLTTIPHNSRYAHVVSLLLPLDLRMPLHNQLNFISKC